MRVLFPVEEGHVVEQVEFLVDPALALSVPPGVLVVERHADPAVQRLLDALVTLGFVAPAQELNQLVAGKGNAPIGEPVEPGQLNQSQNDLVVEGGGQAILLRGGDE